MTNATHQTFQPRPRQLMGRRVALWPLGDQHIEGLYDIIKKEGMAGRWPRRKGSPTREDFERFVWQTSQLQFAIVRRDTGDLIGVVQGLNVDARSRTMSIGTVIDPGLWRRGWPLEGVLLFINFVFRRKGFRKVYFNLPASNVDRLGPSPGRWATKEATLKEHSWNGSGYDDWYIFSLFADDWDTRVVDRLTAE